METAAAYKYFFITEVVFEILRNILYLLTSAELSGSHNNTMTRFNYTTKIFLFHVSTVVMVVLHLLSISGTHGPKQIIEEL